MKRIERLNTSNTAVFYTDYEIEQAESGTRWANYASYYTMDDFLSPPEMLNLNNILKKYDKDLYRGSVVGYTEQEAKDRNIRDTTITFNLNDPKFLKIEEKIVGKIGTINDNIFNLELTSHMPPQYTVYSEKMYFEWHSDGPFGLMDGRGMNCVPDHLQWRKLSHVLMLSEPDEYEGGDFQIMTTSRQPEQSIDTIRLGKGCSITFPAFLSHRVTPVTKGVRKTLVYWVCGPRWR